MKPLVFALVLATLVTGSVSAQSDKDSTDQKVDSLRQDLVALKARLDSLATNTSATSKGLAALSWLKVTGYVQARWEFDDTLAVFDNSSPDAARNNTSSNIYIRRGRIKFTMQPGQSSRYIFQFDASKNSVSLKDAFVDLMKRFGAQQFTLSAGQMNWPFGYEIEYSDTKRDFPERSLAESNLFKGERDRGIYLTWTAPKYLSANLGVFQGTGIEGNWWDPTRRKDVIARAKVHTKTVDFGLSGYWGDSFTPGEASAAGVVKPRNRLGADGQACLNIIPLGATTFRTEYYWAQDYDKSVPKDSLANRQGWYLWLSQALGKKFGAAVRYDYWDPNTISASNDATGTWSFATHYFYDLNVSITVAYDIPKRLKGNSVLTPVANEPKDNRFTLQFQFSI